MSELDLDILNADEINDILNKLYKYNPGLQKYSFTDYLNPCIYNEIDSTNAELKRRIADNDKSSHLIIADSQTMGRGRLGRTFESPGQTGIYMSLLLPDVNPKNVLLITSAAAVAVCRGIRNVSSLSPKIKWVNDIYEDNRKVCGILAEAVSGPSGTINVILGIGINVTTNRSVFSKDVQERAGALFDNGSNHATSRNTIISSIISEFYNIYEYIEDREYLIDYRRWSNVIGRDIIYCENNIWHNAKAIDIDNNGGLIIETEGRIHTLSTGEISVRLSDNSL